MKNAIVYSTVLMLAGVAAFAQTPVVKPPAPQSEVGKRAVHQQQRIAQGVKSGTLTAGQTAKLETKEAAVNREVRTDRAANGGKLTAGEKAQVNRKHNKLSKQIYKDKHS